MAADARRELERLDHELTRLKAEIAAAPERGPELDKALLVAEDARKAADAEVERLAGTLAAVEARAAAETARKRDAEARLTRVTGQFDQARREREALGPLETPELEAARQALETAQDDLAAAREAVEAAEARRGELARAEQEARTAARTAEDRLGRLQTEARGLGPGCWSPASATIHPHWTRCAPTRGMRPPWPPPSATIWTPRWDARAACLLGRGGCVSSDLARRRHAPVGPCAGAGSVDRPPRPMRCGGEGRCGPAGADPAHRRPSGDGRGRPLSLGRLRQPRRGASPRRRPSGPAHPAGRAGGRDRQGQARAGSGPDGPEVRHRGLPRRRGRSEGRPPEALRRRQGRDRRPRPGRESGPRTGPPRGPRPGSGRHRDPAGGRGGRGEGRAGRRPDHRRPVRHRRWSARGADRRPRRRRHGPRRRPDRPLRPRRRGPRPSGARTAFGQSDPRPRRLGQPVKGQRRPPRRPGHGRRQDRRPAETGRDRAPGFRRTTRQAAGHAERRRTAQTGRVRRHGPCRHGGGRRRPRQPRRRHPPPAQAREARAGLAAPVGGRRRKTDRRPRPPCARRRRCRRRSWVRS